MIRFILVRLAQGVVTIAAVATIVFFASRATGDAGALLVPQGASAATAAAIRARFGLDQSIWVQYERFVSGAFHGDFGSSYQTGAPAVDMIRAAAPASLRLAGVAFVLSLMVAFPVGVVAGLRKGSRTDAVARGAAFLGLGVPPFFTGIALIALTVALGIGFLPVAGDASPLSYVLPAITLAVFLSASLMRLVRSGVVEAMDAEYIRMARLKGLSERTVVWKHALPNAMLPVLAYAGLYFVLFMTTAVVVEVVFAWPGIGRVIYTSVLQRDLPVLQAAVIFTSAAAVAVNILVDVVSALIDPRIRDGAVAR